MNLEETLAYLARFGQPRVGMYSAKGWHCHLEVLVTGAGISFEIKSEFKMATPIEAARQCKERLDAALSQLTTQAPTLAG